MSAEATGSFPRNHGKIPVGPAGRPASSLLPHARRLGGESTADGTAAAKLHRRWMDLRSALSGHDDGAVVAEARRGDNVTVLAFKSAVEGVLPATVRDLVEHEYQTVSASHLRFDDLDRPPLKVM